MQTIMKTKKYILFALATLNGMLLTTQKLE